MKWNMRAGGGVELTVDRDEFAVLQLCLSRAAALLDAAEVERATGGRPADLEALGQQLFQAQGDYHRRFGGGPVVELS